jgi:putative lipoic acid-binding regulatory protein
VVERHAPDFDSATLEAVDSRNGRFQSLRVTINATGDTQLRELFASLKATGRVHMVL